MGDTKIEWTKNADGTAGKTWNPIRARRLSTNKNGWHCEHVSEGCRNCYAGRMNLNTYFGNGLDYRPSNLDQIELFLDEKILQQPLHWRKPTNVFVCSMTDLFGRWVKDEWLLAIFNVMRQCSRHTFQILTKRPERMQYFCSRLRFDGAGAGRMWIEPCDVHRVGYRLMGGNGATGMPWVWCGTSIEDQETADKRIPYLLRTPSSVKWISAEPLLGPIDLAKYWANYWTMRGHDHPTERTPGLDWVVVGGESGPNARSLNLRWIKSVVDQCSAASVPVFVKQLGYRPWWDGVSTKPPASHVYLENKVFQSEVGWQFDCMQDRKGGDINEWPEDLRVREYPETHLTQQSIE